MKVLYLVTCAHALTVGILGGQGATGRELVSQCLSRGWSVNAYVRRPDDPVLMPVRRGWLSPRFFGPQRPIVSDRLCVYDSASTLGTENALVSVMSGSPFTDERDTSDTFVHACEHFRGAVCLVSAHGVGDSIQSSNVGIQIMRDWYLKGTYEAKETQEEYLHTWNGTYTILRPKVLSYEPIPCNPVSRTRYSLAREICEWVQNSTKKK